MAFVPFNPITAVFRESDTFRTSSFVSCSNPRKPLIRSSPPSVFPIITSKPKNHRHGTFSMQVVDVKQHDVFMPALSSTMSEGRIVQWLKQPGDAIEAGEPIMVVESDKADMDVEAFESGFLATILVDEGDSCDVGLPVGIIVENKEDIEKVKSSAISAPPSPVVIPSESPQVDTSLDVAPATSTTAKPEMAEIFMPALSSTMTEGKVVEWLKNEGDSVKSGDMVMVVESDKADMDVESFESGIIAHVIVDAGESCPVGEPVAYIANSEADVAAIKAWAASQTSPQSAHVSTAPAAMQNEVPPSHSVSTTSPVVGSHTVVNEGRIIASPLGKAVAKEHGVDLKYVKGTGPNGRIVEKDVLMAKDANVASDDSSPSTSWASTPGKIVATPDAKKVAKKEKIDLATVKGSGNFGRITAEDVLKAAGKAPVSKAKESSTPKTADSAPVEKKELAKMPSGAVVMNAMQKAVVQNMNASLTVPVFRITKSIKTEALDKLYAKLKPKGVTMSALLAKAVAMTLRNHPIMNAAYAENSILHRSDINIAMAVAIPEGGLITPTLKNADETDLYSLSRNWKDLVNRSLEKKLSADEYNSGTFFISNLGMFGVDQFDAILPPGAPGILAVGASKPIVALQDNGLVGVVKEMNVTLTADHRHIYGAAGAEFLKDLTTLIEEDVAELVM